MTEDLRWRDLSQHEGPAEPSSAHRDPGPAEDNPTDAHACPHTVIEYDERGWGTCRLCWQPMPLTMDEQRAKDDRRNR